MEKNKLMMIIIIVLLLVLLGTVVGVSVFAYQFLRNSANITADASKSSDKVNKKLTQEEIITVDIDEPVSTELITDVDKKPHAIRFKMSIGVNNTDKKNSQKLVDLLAARTSVIQDRVLSVVRNKTYEDLKGVGKDAQAILSQEILEKLQVEFSSDLIVDVYITGIVVQ